jgi:hypothetical protein
MPCGVVKSEILDLVSDSDGVSGDALVHHLLDVSVEDLHHLGRHSLCRRSLQLVRLLAHGGGHGAPFLQ